MTDSNDPNALAERIATSIQDRIDEANSSRRGFLTRSALAGGTLLALGGGTGVAWATNDEGNMASGGAEATFDDVLGTDVDVLNYALTLEHLEDAFYQEAFETFDEDDFMEAESLQGYDEESRQEVFGYLQSVGEHESTHVDVLTQAVELLSGDPVSAAEYDFGIESVGDFLELGQVFENTGVAAYAGAAPYIESPDLLSAALSIHSVEARHAAFLNALNGDPPAPDAFDAALSQEEVLDAVSPFIGSSDGEADEGDSEGAEDGEEAGGENGEDASEENGEDAEEENGEDDSGEDGEGTDGAESE